ncbi:MAG: putative lipid II flippase FtsW [Desulfobacterales bacterium]
MTTVAATSRLPYRAVRAPAYDLTLLFSTLLLVGIGIVMVYSASSALALRKFGSEFYFLKKQAAFAATGICLLVLCRHLPYRLYRPLAYPMLAVALALLAAVVFSPLAVSAGGASRWLRIGPLQFQPSEIARFALIVYLAYSMEKKAARMRELSIGFLPHLFVTAVLASFVLKQPDFGSAVILAALAGLMLFLGGVRLSFLCGTLLLGALLGWIHLQSAGYRRRRWESFWDPWQYASDQGYQAIHSLMAFASGGWWGTGIGKSHQKLFYLPEPHTDFIFAVIGEELGVAGAALIVTLFALILWRGVGIARRAPDLFGSYLAAGITAALGLQVVINMGVALALLPTKGLTLPFLSYGGTSLVLNMGAVGILMNIAGSGREPSPKTT